LGAAETAECERRGAVVMEDHQDDEGGKSKEEDFGAPSRAELGGGGGTGAASFAFPSLMMSECPETTANV